MSHRATDFRLPQGVEPGNGLLKHSRLAQAAQRQLGAYVRGSSCLLRLSWWLAVDPVRCTRPLVLRTTRGTLAALGKMKQKRPPYPHPPAHGLPTDASKACGARPPRRPLHRTCTAIPSARCGRPSHPHYLPLPRV
eukprot:gene13466-biopygen21566